MSFLKELTDKGATVAWSEVSAHPNLIALGTKVILWLWYFFVSLCASEVSPSMRSLFALTLLD